MGVAEEEEEEEEDRWPSFLVKKASLETYADVC